VKLKNIFVLKEAADDLNEGGAFYDRKETGIGDYFWDSLIADIESLIIYAGIHNKRYGLYRIFAKRFPYAIYYEIVEEVTYVIAVLPMRQDPGWIKKKLKKRR